jgi:capsule polysaccharide export protein KpsC/LpsZ
LNSIDGVFFADISHNAFELIDNCLFVATITGTVGVESVVRGKPVLVFGDPWYRGIPGSININEIKDANCLKNFLSSFKSIPDEDLVEFCYKIFSTSAYGAINPSNEKYLKGSMNHSIKNDTHSIASIIHSMVTAKKPI